MRFIFTADWHIHPWRECSRDGGQDRLNDGLSAVRQCLQAARDRDCPLVVGGDLKQPKGRWELAALNGLLALFEEYADVPKVLLHGNHDGVGGGRSGLRALEQVWKGYDSPFVFEVPAVIKIVTVFGEPVAVWPHQPALDGLPVFLEQARKARARVLFAHAFLSGAALGPDEVRLRKGATLEQFGLAGKGRVFACGFFGDIHKAQALRGAGGAWVGSAQNVLPTKILKDLAKDKISWVLYPGSPYQQNWGEREDPPKGALYVDLDAGTVEVVPVNAPRFRVSDWTSGNNKALEAFAGGVKVSGKEFITDWQGDFVRLVVGSWADGKLLERIHETSGARAFQVIVKRESKAEQRADIHAAQPAGDMLAEYVKARPPQDGLDSGTLLAAGKRLLEG